MEQNITGNDLQARLTAVNTLDGFGQGMGSFIQGLAGDAPKHPTKTWDTRRDQKHDVSGLVFGR